MRKKNVKHNFKNIKLDLAVGLNQNCNLLANIGRKISIYFVNFQFFLPSSTSLPELGLIYPVPTLHA